MLRPYPNTYFAVIVNFLELPLYKFSMNPKRLLSVTTALAGLAVTASVVGSAFALPETASAQSSNQTKVSQCNQIIAIANEAVRNAKSITNSGQASNSASMLRAANAMDFAASELEIIAITDPRLQAYKARFIQMYRETSQATRAFVEAFDRKDRPAAETALTRLQQATNPEKQLVADLNSYCR